MDKEKKIIEYLNDRGWIEKSVECVFLAAGEYNENYLVKTDDNCFVFRINHGTQLGLENQIEYEFKVLKAIQGSGVTPTPYFYSQDGGDLGNGVLLMQFLNGRSLDYRKDLLKAARIFARIHSSPPSNELILQQNPLQDICKESYGLLTRYSPAYYKKVYTMLVTYYETLMIEDHGAGRLFEDEADCIVNTEVNSGNFIINDDKGYLVDWEKAVVSCRYQDLAHFLLPTTTLWKTDVRLQHDQREIFLTQYVNNLEYNMSLSVVKERTMLLERIIILRALSWCFMAYHEYKDNRKALTDERTLTTITSYLNEAECFLK